MSTDKTKRNLNGSFFYAYYFLKTNCWGLNYINGFKYIIYISLNLLFYNFNVDNRIYVYFIDDFCVFYLLG